MGNRHGGLRGYQRSHHCCIVRDSTGSIPEESGGFAQGLGTRWVSDQLLTDDGGQGWQASQRSRKGFPSNSQRSWDFWDSPGPMGSFWRKRKLKCESGGLGKHGVIPGISRLGLSLVAVQGCLSPPRSPSPSGPNLGKWWQEWRRRRPSASGEVVRSSASHLLGTKRSPFLPHHGSRVQEPN